MTEIYVECRKFIFKLFLNACRVHSGVFFPSHFAISAFVVAVNCVCALVCQCANVFLFLPSVCTSIGRVPVEKGEKRNGETNTVFIHSTKDTKTMPTNVISKISVEIHSARVFSCDNQTGYSSLCWLFKIWLLACSHVQRRSFEFCHVLERLWTHQKCVFQNIF